MEKNEYPIHIQHIKIYKNHLLIVSIQTQDTHCTMLSTHYIRVYKLYIYKERDPLT